MLRLSNYSGTKAAPLRYLVHNEDSGKVNGEGSIFACSTVVIALSGQPCSQAAAAAAGGPYSNILTVITRT